MLTVIYQIKLYKHLSCALLNCSDVFCVLLFKREEICLLFCCTVHVIWRYRLFICWTVASRLDQHSYWPPAYVSSRIQTWWENRCSNYPAVLRRDIDYSTMTNWLSIWKYEAALVVTERIFLRYKIQKRFHSNTQQMKRTVKIQTNQIKLCRIRFKNGFSRKWRPCKLSFGQIQNKL